MTVADAIAYAVKHPQIIDPILLWLVCAPALKWDNGWYRLCAMAFIASFFIVSGYEVLTGHNAARDNIYILADVVCMAWLMTSFWRSPQDFAYPSLAILFGFSICCMIEGLKLMGLLTNMTAYWEILRAINLAQLLIMGGHGCARGARSLHRRGHLRGISLGGREGLHAAFRSPRQ